MADKAREWTDEQLEKLEKKISRTYKQAEKELTKKWKAYMKEGEARLSALEKEYAKAKKSGDATSIAKAKDKLQKAKENYTLRSQYYKDMVDSVTLDIAKVNQMALTYVNNELPRIYAANYEQIKDQLDDLSVSFSLVDKNTVMRMIDDGDIKLPKKKIDVPKDQKWNTKKINSSVLQGILQGESIGDISKRLLPIMDNNRVSAIRNARTLVTGAENRGRLDSYNSLKEQGAVLKKVWIATGDSRTRDWHLIMDGQEVDIDEDFVDGNGNKLEYPADPSSAPETVYNCRCSMRSHIVGFRAADGSISYINYFEPESGLHEQQIEAEKARRKEESAQKEQVKAQKKAEKAEKSQPQQKEILHGDKDAHDILEKRAKNNNIKHKEVKELEKTLSENEIIERLAGGDMTTGSCSSLALAYCANKNGLDVLDFRGGESRTLFATTFNIPLAYRTANAEIIDFSVKKEAKDVAKIIKGIDDNREYVLITGKHASVIRKFDGELKYLELQSSTKSGWQPFEYTVETSWAEYKQTTEDTLRTRFGCRKTVDKDRWTGYVFERKGWLVPVDSVQDTQEFRNIMGYINTDQDKQKKGMSGNVK